MTWVTQQLLGLAANLPRGALLGLVPILAAFVAPASAEPPQGFLLHAVPKAVPEIAFADGEGEPLNLADFRGRTVLLNVWATWCPPCREEMPALDALAGALEGPELEVIALSTDRTGAGRVAKFFDDTGVENLEIAVDPRGDVMRAAGIMGLPLTLILDREGREVARMIGDADWDSPEARALIGRVIEMTRPGEAGTET
jgi:thiol-disulfide isomerase/thioredoxin